MLLKLGNCLIDPQKVVYVEKRKREWGLELLVSFGDQPTCIIKALSDKELDEFFDTIWTASAITVGTCNWEITKSGEEENG